MAFILGILILMNPWSIQDEKSGRQLRGIWSKNNVANLATGCFD